MYLPTHPLSPPKRPSPSPSSVCGKTAGVIYLAGLWDTSKPLFCVAGSSAQHTSGVAEQLAHPRVRLGVGEAAKTLQCFSHLFQPEGIFQIQVCCLILFRKVRKLFLHSRAHKKKKSQSERGGLSLVTSKLWAETCCWGPASSVSGVALADICCRGNMRATSVSVNMFHTEKPSGPNCFTAAFTHVGASPLYFKSCSDWQDHHKDPLKVPRIFCCLICILLFLSLLIFDALLFPPALHFTLPAASIERISVKVCAWQLINSNKL